MNNKINNDYIFLFEYKHKNINKDTYARIKA